MLRSSDMSFGVKLLFILYFIRELLNSAEKFRIILNIEN
jgi:hypothetical protein